MNFDDLISSLDGDGGSYESGVRKRITISIDTGVLEVYKKYAESLGSSGTGWTIGDWLAVTAGGAAMMTKSIEDLKYQPLKIAQELHEMSVRTTQVSGDVLRRIQGAASGLTPPYSNTGGKGVGDNNLEGGKDV